jgi:hypothetical protein
VSLATRRMRHVGFRLAGDRGFEPLLTDPESVVLPLDESPITKNGIIGIRAVQPDGEGASA